MKIIMTRTGGFTGIPLKKTIDTATLPKDQAQKIEKLVTQANFGNVEQSSNQATKPAKPGADWYPDSFTYSLSVQNGEQSQEIKIPEQSLSDPMKKIIHLLTNT